jgi:hypothetical protein
VVRSELLGTRVFVFTEGGRILNLARGATLADAAAVLRVYCACRACRSTRRVASCATTCRLPASHMICSRRVAGLPDGAVGAPAGAVFRVSGG